MLLTVGYLYAVYCSHICAMNNELNNILENMKISIIFTNIIQGGMARY